MSITDLINESKEKGNSVWCCYFYILYYNVVNIFIIYYMLFYHFM